MFKELFCPACHKSLSVSKRTVICKTCKKHYPLKNNVLQLWSIKDEKKSKGKDVIEKELAFTSSLSKKKTQHEAEEFIIRDTQGCYAAKKIDEKGLGDIKKLLPTDLSKLRILDIGAGYGKEAEYLLRWGAKYLVLTDLSPDFLSIAANRIRAKYVFQANAEHLPVKSKSFDIALFGSILHHVPDPFQALDEACRVADIVAAVNEPSDMYEFKWILEKTGWNTEYGNLKTHRFNPTVLKKYFMTKGYSFRYTTDYIWFPITKLKNISNNKAFVDTYFSLLSLADILLPRYGHNISFVAYRNV